MIRLENLTKTFVMYGQRKTVADNLNATFPSRTAVALLGRNGAGKSTLLNMIAGTLEPTSGSHSLHRPGVLAGGASQAPSTRT